MSESNSNTQSNRERIRSGTVQSVLQRAVAKFADHPLITSCGTTLTYREAWQRGGRLASYLDDCGLVKGDRVGLMISNRVEYVTAIIGLARGGFVNVPMNDMLGADEYRHILNDSQAMAVLVDDELSDALAEVTDNVTIDEVISIGDQAALSSREYTSIVADESRAGYDAAVEPEDVFALQYTGGTTGRPKGVKHTNFGWTMDLYSHLIELDIGSKERMLFTTPLPHAAGMQLQAGLLRGAHVTVSDEFTPESFVETVDEADISWTLMVPTMIYSVLDSTAVEDADLSSLQTIAYGAAPIARDRLSEAIDVFGQVFIQSYGLTEVPLLGTVLPKTDHTTATDERLESCGRPATMAEVQIADPDEKENIIPVPTGEVGEILLRAPYAMVEYHGLPEKTEQALVNGWVRTGDIGKQDEDGYVYILDRDKDMIISGGMNVYSTTVEDALIDHAAVAEAAVIGIPDEKWGEAVHAFVVLTEDAAVTELELKEFTESDLSRYEVPKTIEIVTELPVTPYGKIDKKQLREPYWEDQSRNVGGGGDTA